MKWLPILQTVLRDIVIFGFGAWIIYKQVYAVHPNAWLGGIGFAFMIPAARAAVLSILYGPGPSSSSSQSPEERSSEHSSPGGTGEKS